MNGVCEVATQRCRCDPPWTGARCQTLDFLPAHPQTGLHVPNETTWGASTVFDAGTRRWVMLASAMSSGCGMGAWESNSHTVRASSAAPLSTPFVCVDRTSSAGFAPAPAAGRWSHEVALVRAPPPGQELVAFFSCQAPGSPPRQPLNCSRGGRGWGRASSVPRAGSNGSIATQRRKRPRGVDTDPTCMSWARNATSSWSHPLVITPAGGVSIDTNAAPVIERNGSVLGLWRDHREPALPRGQHSRPHVFRARHWKDAGSYTWDPQDLWAARGPRAEGAVEDMFLYRDSVRGAYHALFHTQFGCRSCGGHAYSRSGGVGPWVWTGVK
jgi:hypothetical protein